VLVIFDKLRWQGYPVDVALPVGRRVPPRALKWLQTFAHQQGHPLLYGEQVTGECGLTGEQSVYGFGPPQFLAWVSQCESRGQQLW